MKRYFLIMITIMVAGFGGIVGSLVTLRYLTQSGKTYKSIDERQQLLLARYSSDTAYNVPGELDFLSAAKRVTSGVVHIRVSYAPGDFSVNPLQFYQDMPSRSSGSGVIISDDGYIVTNTHVIEDATNIEVVLNDNQRYFAKLIGMDPSTDLALLKVKAEGLPFVQYGDSDNIRLGEWVLAIGNPFDLNSTVTAGIISAKARNIGILRDRNNLQIESFIQTDAAVNPGNSGGALVNLNGQLIGINTAIATSSGSYQGYSFAIPVSLVRKVMDDLLEFGQVQRGLLGIQIQDVNANVAEELGIETLQGVLVNRVNIGSAAEDAGILRGDIITAINSKPVASVSELQEFVARNRPGKEISVTLIRNGNSKIVYAKLKNSEGSIKLVKREVTHEVSGAVLEDIPYKELTRLQLDGGVRIKDLHEGKWKDAGIRKGFIITFIDKVPVENVNDLNRILEYKKGGILVEGFYADRVKGIFGVDW